MPNTDYHKRLTDNAALLVEQVKARVEYFIDELWPALVELRPPAERMEWYRNIDWNALHDASELIWARLSADAKRLMAAQEAQMQVNPIIGYEQQAFDQQRAFRAETQPFGQMQSAIEPYVLGQQTPLPLGRMGG